jgi:sugar phosphate isomerase/epimerase
MIGFNAVDIGLFEGRSHLQPSKMFKNTIKNGRRLKRALDNRGLRPADIFLQSSTEPRTYAANHPDSSRRRKARRDFLNTVEFAAECGSRHVTGLPGAFFEEESRADSFARCCEEMNWRREQAHELSLVFSPELHVGSIAPTPRAALRLLKRVPGLTLTLDYTHYARSGMPDCAVEPLIQHASHFHARCARRNRLQTTLARNTIDYERIVRVMQKTAYHGYIGIELVWTEWERCNEVDNLSETILLRNHIQALFDRS